VIKQIEVDLFENLRRDNPTFESSVLKWEPGQDPPDFVGTREDGSRVGVELTEWLDGHQASASIRRTEALHTFWIVLNADSPPCPKNCSAVQISLKEDGVRLSKKHESRFRTEFFELLTYLDEEWDRLLAGFPMPGWTEFGGFPAVEKYVAALTFLTYPIGRRYEKQWVIFEGTGGAYSPQWAMESLFARIRAKTLYRGISETYGLSDLALVVHRGLKGIMHNAPYEGMNFGLNNIVDEVRATLAQDAGPFTRIYLYFAFNEGRLVQVLPR
jgi:hypothetical protein